MWGLQNSSNRKDLNFHLLTIENETGSKKAKGNE